MKFLSLIVLSLTLSLSSVAQENWSVDNAHSNLRFEVGWEDFSVRTGEFKVFNGSITSNSREDLSDASFALTVDASSVDVIADRLAEHVKSDKFLNVEQHPEITFVSSSATKTGDNAYTAMGSLTIHGIEKEQEVSVIVKGSKETRKGEILGLEVSLVVNKADYGLDWGSPRLGDNITLVGHILYKLEVEEEE